MTCIAAVLAGAACQTQPPADLGAVASRYIQVARDLARHDPSLIDHWLTSPPADDRPRRPVAELRARVDALAAEVAEALPATGGDDRVRTRHLDGQVRALQLAARRLLGESLPFDAETRMGLGLEPQRPNLVRAEQARAALARTLPGDRPLAERVSALRARFVVPPDRRGAVLRAALDQCREAIRDRVPLPADEHIELTLVDGLPWDAHARYLGGHRTRVDVNGSRPLDLSRALRLACHEGYPGHHAQYIWTADTLVAGRGWFEFALVPGFGPDLLMAEGAAEAGADLAMPAHRRSEAYRRLAQVAGLSHLSEGDLAQLVRLEHTLGELEPLLGDIARDYIDNRINGVSARDRLTAEALLSDADGFVSFIERRRSRVLAYAEGRRVVGEQLAASGLAGLRALVTGGVRSVE